MSDVQRGGPQGQPNSTFMTSLPISVRSSRVSFPNHSRTGSRPLASRKNRAVMTFSVAVIQYMYHIRYFQDMLIRGGENVYPQEIEDFLLTHPDVAAAEVFGVPDERYGEEVCAFVITRPGRALTEEGLREFCRGRIAHYKAPRHVRFVSEMPVTATGKPQKFRMRERMIEELGLLPS